jgi:uncharacterized protein (DUF1810 family)
MKWLDRALVTSPICYGLCTSKKDFKRALKRLKMNPNNFSFVAPGFNAMVHTFASEGKQYSIVCLGKTKGYTQTQIYGLLIHETTHIWQHIKRSIGESKPSREFEAYSIQRISQSLIFEWNRQHDLK